MQFQHFLTARRLVQSVNILSNYCAEFPHFLKLCQLLMCLIGLRIQKHHLFFIKLIETFRILYTDEFLELSLFFKAFQASYMPATLSNSLAEVRFASLVAWAYIFMVVLTSECPQNQPFLLSYALSVR